MTHVENSEDGPRAVEFTLGSYDYIGEFDGKELRLRTYDAKSKLNIEIVAHQTPETDQKYAEFFSTFARSIADQIVAKKIH